MVSSVKAVKLLAKTLIAYDKPPLVVDPVLMSTSGHELSSDAVASSMVQYLFPIATVVCPNVPEAEILTGQSINNTSDMESAAKSIKAMGPRLVLIKGGHLKEHTIEDVLYDGQEIRIIRHSRIQTDRLHGTGCTLASAIASGIAQGRQPMDAVRLGVRYVHEALANSTSMVMGTGRQLPFHHGYRWHPWPKTRSLRTTFDLRLYGITDRSLDEKHRRRFLDSVRAAMEGGVTMLQIRDKDGDAVEFLERVRMAMETADVPVIVNDRIDVAIAADADGVHVGQEDIPAETARKLIGWNKLLGVSTKTVEQAVAAERAGADYLGVGAIFPTQTKSSDVIGLSVLAEICRSVSIPVVAIGGVQAHHAIEVVGHGAQGIAVISAIFDATDVCEAAKKLRQSMDDAIP